MFPREKITHVRAGCLDVYPLPPAIVSGRVAPPASCYASASVSRSPCVGTAIVHDFRMVIASSPVSLPGSLSLFSPALGLPSRHSQGLQNQRLVACQGGLDTIGTDCKRIPVNIQCCPQKCR
jgi:hypothetical protein